MTTHYICKLQICLILSILSIFLFYREVGVKDSKLLIHNIVRINIFVDATLVATAYGNFPKLLHTNCFQL